RIEAQRNTLFLFIEAQKKQASRSARSWFPCASVIWNLPYNAGKASASAAVQCCRLNEDLGRLLQRNYIKIL
ncbi:hypothetical protein QQP08_020175, partial [Theobroma cacao]